MKYLIYLSLLFAIIANAKSIKETKNNVSIDFYVKDSGVTKKTLQVPSIGGLITGMDADNSNNIKLHLGANQQLEFVKGDDTTAEGVASSNKVAIRFKGGLPVGAIIPWYDANGTAIQDCFVLCNGAVINESRSVINGHYTPNMNGDAYLTGTTTNQDWSGVAATLGSNDVTAKVPQHFHGDGSLATSSGTHTTDLTHDHPSLALAGTGAHNSSLTHNHASYTAPLASSGWHNGGVVFCDSAGICGTAYIGDGAGYQDMISPEPLGYANSIHHHTLDLPPLNAQNSISNGEHHHTVDLPLFTGNSPSGTGVHTHPSADFSGNVGYTSGVDADNAAFTLSGTSDSNRPKSIRMKFVMKICNY